MDFLGLINPPSPAGKNYILLIGDYMTKWIGGIICNKATGEEVGEA